MNKFKFLEVYKVSDTQQNSDLKHKFYTINTNSIEVAEQKLKFQIPSELKQFYKEIGYGFFGKMINVVLIGFYLLYSWLK